MRVEPKTIGIPAVSHNCYTTSRTVCSWEKYLLVGIEPRHETEFSTGGTIAPTDLLPPEYRR